jgi:hypothetical protein
MFLGAFLRGVIRFLFHFHLFIFYNFRIGYQDKVDHVKAGQGIVMKEGQMFGILQVGRIMDIPTSIKIRVAVKLLEYKPV